MGDLSFEGYIALALSYLSFVDIGKSDSNAL